QEAASYRAVGEAVELLADAESADGISRPIGQQRKVQPLLLRVRPVRVGAVPRDAEHPHPERLELLVAVAQRAQLAAAGIRPVVQVEAEQNRAVGGQFAGRDRSHILLQQRGIRCRGPKLEHERRLPDPIRSRTIAPTSWGGMPPQEVVPTRPDQAPQWLVGVILLISVPKK